MFSRGDKIKEYEVIAPLRSGGMAMLYLARRRGVGGFSRLVALKLVHSHLADDASINRLFLREARITASVAHPNVVNVEEVGKADGYYFMAMEYVHGVSLAELLGSLQKRRLRMSSKLCIWVAAHVAEALHAAHEATGENGDPLQIVHRDVSPQNVLIGHNGHVKLIDFGIAKSYPLSRHATGNGAVLGKLGYMAPEQLRIGPVDRRTDVYALGVMVWEMLTSRSLFRCIRIDDERDWLTRESPPAPSRNSPISTPALDRVVCKAIAFDPRDRYDNALEFRSALLQADPAAAEVDAPRFAALMRTMLGDELERRRASWPSEVNVELDNDAEKTTGGRGLNIDELTAKMRSSEAPDGPAEDDNDEPTTVREPPISGRIERALAATSVEPAARRFVGHAAVPSSAAQTPAMGVPRSGVEAIVTRAFAARRRGALHAFGLGGLCVSLATILGAPAASPPLRPSVKMEVGTVLSNTHVHVDRRAPLAERTRPSRWLIADGGYTAPGMSLQRRAEPAAPEPAADPDLGADEGDAASEADAASKDEQDVPRIKRVAKSGSSHAKNRKSSGAKSKSRSFRRSPT
jgi:serine/threonine-protein kinase